MSQALGQSGPGVSLAGGGAAGDAEALQKVDSRGKTAPDAHTARLEAELKRNRHALSSRQRPDDACAGEAECSGPGWLMPLAPG